MKKIYYIFHLWRKSWLKNMFVFLITASIIFLLEFACSQEHCVNNQLKLLKSLDKEVFFSFNNPNYTIQDVYQALEQSKEFHYVRIAEATAKEKQFQMYYYDNYLKDTVRFDFAAGGWFDTSKEEVVLTKGAEKYYEVGDKICLEYLDENYKTQRIEKEVAGILSNNAVFAPDAMGTSFATDDMVQVLDTQDFTDTKGKGLGIISNDERFFSSELSQEVGILESKTGTVDEALLEQWNEQSKKFGYIARGSELVKSQLEEQNRQKKEVDMLAVCIILITIVAIGSSSFLEVIGEKRETAIYYIQGFTKREVWWIKNIKYIITLLLAAAVGNEFFQMMLHKGQIMDVVFSKIYIAYAVGCIAFIYMIATVPVYLVYRKIIIIDLLREGTE